jgi:hypothetical protein
LQPFYTNSLSIRFQQSPLPTKKTASFNLRVLAAMTRREITPSVIFPIDTGQVIEKSTFLNTGASHSLSSDYQIGFPAAIKKTISINLGGGMGFTTDSRTVNNVTSPLSTFVWSQGVSARMVLLESFQGSFSGVYSNTHTQYTRSAIGGSGDTTIRILAINLSGRHFIAKHWTVSYQFSQPYSGGSRRLYTQPGDLQASLKRDFLAGNKATFFVSGYNLLNESTAFTQSGSSPTVVESRQFISGRYFVCGFQIKLERFRSAEK